MPLLIEPARIEALAPGLYAAMFRARLDVGRSSPPPPTRPAPPEERPRGYRVDRGVATLPVRGVLVRRAGQMTPDSTLLQSYQNLTQVLRAARSDSRVRGILLEVDSPGGEAGGVFDFADEVRRTTQIKPVWAIANDDALSAAYAIAAAAERVWITNTGAAGSIGVVALHADQSRFDAEAGFNFTYIYKGARKIDANPHMPLSPEARGQIQGEVDRLYDMLIASVAGHRRMAPSDWPRPRPKSISATTRSDIGLADRVGTIDEAPNALAEQVAPNSRRGSGYEQRRHGTATATHDDTLPRRAYCDRGAQPDNVISFDQVRPGSGGDPRKRGRDRRAVLACRLSRTGRRVHQDRGDDRQRAPAIAAAPRRPRRQPAMSRPSTPPHDERQPAAPRSPRPWPRALPRNPNGPSDAGPRLDAADEPVEAASGTAPAAPPSPAPVLSSLTPNHMEVDAVMRVLVNGSGFTPQSSVHFAGAEQSTEFVSDAQLAFEIEADEPGEFPVTVVTPPGPGGGGGESNALMFEIHEPEPEADPEPSLASLQPSSTQATRSTSRRR